MISKDQILFQTVLAWDVPSGPGAISCYHHCGFIKVSQETDAGIKLVCLAICQLFTWFPSSASTSYSSSSGFFHVCLFFYFPHRYALSSTLFLFLSLENVYFFIYFIFLAPTNIPSSSTLLLLLNSQGFTPFPWCVHVVLSLALQLLHSVLYFVKDPTLPCLGPGPRTDPCILTLTEVGLKGIFWLS